MFVIAEILGALGLTTALFDMGMNGGRYARWSPYGLAVTGVSCIVMWATWPV